MSVSSMEINGRTTEEVEDSSVGTSSKFKADTFSSKFLSGSTLPNALDPSCYLSTKINRNRDVLFRNKPHVDSSSSSSGFRAPLRKIPDESSTGELSGNPLYAKMSLETTLSSQKLASVPSQVKSPDGYVGFATLPNQLHRRAVKRGFVFNLMVVGESGLGKSTFINSLFLTELYNAENLPTHMRKTKTVQVESTTVLLTENNVCLNLTLVDTPGFGDAVDNSNCWQPIVNYIDAKYEEYLNAESRVNRSLPITDNRIHCCLYFIAPTGHGLRSVDVELMKQLHTRVNIVPLIAKADALTTDELKKFKKNILEDLKTEKIRIYDFKSGMSSQDEQDDVRSFIPFAVVGSNCVVEIGGNLTRGRQYPWGIVDVENVEHCDFIPLRKMLIRTHMYDLRDTTHTCHYEAYRLRKLLSLSGNGPKNRTLLSQIEEERREHENRLERTRLEMQQIFDTKVAEKLKKLEETRQSVRKAKENYERTLNDETKRYEAKKSEFERAKSEAEQCSLRSETSGSLRSLHDLG